VKASFSYYRRETGRTPGVKQSGAFHVAYGVHHSAMLGFRAAALIETAAGAAVGASTLPPHLGAFIVVLYSVIGLLYWTTRGQPTT
jgi:hypothetical protein